MAQVRGPGQPGTKLEDLGCPTQDELEVHLLCSEVFNFLMKRGHIGLSARSEAIITLELCNYTVKQELLCIKVCRLI